MSWHQSSFLSFQIAHIIHYNHIRNTDPIYKNKLRDTIYINKSELKNIIWLEHDEIRYDGKMFDLKRQLTDREQILLIGHYDSKDELLLAATFCFFDDDATTGQNKKHSIKLLLFDAILSVHQKEHAPLLTQHTKTAMPFTHLMCEAIYLANISPPPELLRVS